MRKKKNKKVSSTYHGLERFEERVSDEDKDKLFMIRNAKKYGSNPDDFPDGQFRNYLLNRKENRNKLIKVYNGYIFIFFKTSGRLITMYPIPDKYLDACNKQGVNVKDIYKPKKNKN